VFQRFLGGVDWFKLINNLMPLVAGVTSFGMSSPVEKFAAFHDYKITPLELFFVSVKPSFKNQLFPISYVI
jgi:hypothetical protein